MNSSGAFGNFSTKFKMALVACIIFLCLVQSGRMAEEMHFDFPAETMEVPAEPEDGKTVLSASGNANNYLDSLLQNAKPLLTEKADPLTLPDYQTSVRKKFGLITLTGGFQANDGTLRGLSTLHRAGDATLYTTKDSGLKIKATLALDNLFVGSNQAKVWLGKLRIPFGLSATVKYVKATLELATSLQKDTKPEVTEFVIHEIGAISVNIKRLGPLNFILKGLGSLFLNMLRNVLKTKLQTPLLKVLNDAVQKLDFNSLVG